MSSGFVTSMAKSKHSVDGLSTARLKRAVNNGAVGNKPIDRLLDVAERRRLSEADLARKLGHKTQQRLWNWKVRGIPRAELLPISQRLGLNPIWLQTGVGPETQQDQPRVAPLDAGFLEYIIGELETALELADDEIPPAKKARLIVRIYTDYAGTGERPGRAVILNLVRSAA